MKKKVLFIMGATGNLSNYKLYPAIYSLIQRELVSDVEIIGVSCDNLSDPQFVKLIKEKSNISLSDATYIPEDFSKGHLDNVKNHIKSLPDNAELFFYLAVSPVFFKNLIEDIHSIKIETEKDVNILIEKPYGASYNDTLEINTFIEKTLGEDSVYRIDHYLGKYGYHQLLKAKSSLKTVWNSQHIDEVSIVMTETAGIEERLSFYRDSGAIADTVQNHILQMIKGVIIDKDNYDEANKSMLNNLIDQVGSDSSFFKGRQYFDFEQPTMIYGSFTLDMEPWKNVRFNIVFGKKMDKKETAVIIYFKGKNKPLVINIAKQSPSGLSEYALLIKDFLEKKHRFFISAQDCDYTWIFGDRISRSLNNTYDGNIEKYTPEATTLNDVLHWIKNKR